MSRKEKALPKPPTTPFGRGRQPGEDEAPLMADKIAMAMSEGKLDEFMEKELPDNAYARELVSMMMGMSGMGFPRDKQMVPQPDGKDPGDEQSSHDNMQPESMPSEDILNAVQKGDVMGLMHLLKREHLKRSPGAEDPDQKQPEAAPDAAAGIEKEVVDSLIRISAENNVSIDWVLFRALKLYVRDYRETGRL